MKRIIICIVFIFLFNQLYAQTPSIISARVALAVVNIQDDSDYHGIVVSFINHSDNKIYVPDIENMLLVDYNQGAVIVNRNDTNYAHFTDVYFETGHRLDSALKEWGYSKTGSGRSGFVHPPMDLLNKRSQPLARIGLLQLRMYVSNDRIIEDYKVVTEGKRMKKKMSLVNSLYLRPHEEKKYVFVTKAESIFNKPGQYKIVYDPMLDSSYTRKYPEEINGYKKYIPHKIPSNVIYIEVEK